MQTVHFSTVIDAKREVVWDVMLGPTTYGLWTAAFAEGSRYEGSWEQGAGIRFLASDGNGVVSVIAENRPFEFVSIKHIGMISNGVEDTTSEAVRAWAPSFENYTFGDRGFSTELRVDMDVTTAFEEYMANTWPKALAKLKDLCEGRPTPSDHASG